MSKKNDVITYVPQSNEDYEDSGRLRRGVRFYTHQLGMNFTLVLLLALLFQFGVAAFIGFAGVANVPMLANMAQEPFPQLVRFVVALAGAALVQVLIVAEMAQVVWLRHPDWLKVRLMSGSVWWWIMLVALVITTLIDLILFFLSVTGQRNLGPAFAYAFQDQLTFGLITLLFILNLLTLLRCASVMRTSSAAEIKSEVEERLKAIAEEILIDAGDSVRTQANQVFKKLAINPQRLVPLQEAVLSLVAKSHPELSPDKLGGDSWAYDFSTHTLAAMPPEVYQAMMYRKYMAGQGKEFKDHDVNDVWRKEPEEMAQLISYQLDTLGKPRMADATDPQEPKYLTKKLRLLEGPGEARHVEGLPSQAQPQNILANPLETLTEREKTFFAAYLLNVVFPHVHGAAFPIGQNIYSAFDEVELQWYYRYWKKSQLQKGV